MVSPASWMVKLFGEVCRGVPEYLSSGEVFQYSYREKTVLKTLELEFSNVADFNTRNKLLIQKLLKQGYQYH